MKTLTITVETPKGCPGKFDRNSKTGAISLNKVLPKGMVFPFDFGFIPQTIGEDGDPLDVVVLCEMGTFPGCEISCRLIGVIQAEQKEIGKRKVRNDRFLVVPECSRDFAGVRGIKDLNKKLLNELEAFFTSYNVQAGKQFKVIARSGPSVALALLHKGMVKDVDPVFLIQLFLPLRAKKSATEERIFARLEKELLEKFGGVSIYSQSPVEGRWQSGGKRERDMLIVFELMSGSIDQEYLIALRTRLEKELDQHQVLIRCMPMGII